VGVDKAIPALQRSGVGEGGRTYSSWRRFDQQAEGGLSGGAAGSAGADVEYDSVPAAHPAAGWVLNTPVDTHNYTASLAGEPGGAPGSGCARLTGGIKPAIPPSSNAGACW
jgi:hypothetical protein